MANIKKLTRAEQKVVRPLQILDAAFEEFIAHGFSATRVEDIAARIGVTKGTIYVYFETKERLFEEMIAHISVPFEESLKGTDSLTGEPMDKLIAVSNIMYHQVAEERRTREMLRLFIAEGPKFPELIDRHHQHFIAPLTNRIEAILQEGIALKVFRPRPAGFAELVFAPIMMATILRLIYGDRLDLDREAFLKAQVDLMSHGLLID